MDVQNKIRERYGEKWARKITIDRYGRLFGYVCKPWTAGTRR